MAGHQHPKVRLAALLLVVLWSGTACNDAGPDAAVAADPSPATAVSSPTPGASEGSSVETKGCASVDPAVLADIIGNPVTLAEGPSGDCAFTSEDPRGVSGSLGSVAIDTGNGGWEAYRAASSSMFEGAQVTPAAGIAGDSFVCVGTLFGGSHAQAAGAVRRGGTAWTVNIAQGQNLPVQKVRRLSTDLLTVWAPA